MERVRALFARFNETGELEVGALDPDVELHSRPDVPDAKVWRGVDGVRGFFAELAEAFDPIRYEPRELIAAGRHVVVRAQVVGYGATSGTPIEVEEVQPGHSVKAGSSACRDFPRSTRRTRPRGP